MLTQPIDSTQRDIINIDKACFVDTYQGRNISILSCNISNGDSRCSKCGKSIWLYHIVHSIKKVIFKGDSKIRHDCLHASEQTRRDILYVLETVVLDEHILDSIIIEVDSEVDVGHNWVWSCILNKVIRYLHPSVGRDGALEGDMLKVDRNLGINPLSVNELIVREGDITVVLSVYQSCVAANINS